MLGSRGPSLALLGLLGLLGACVPELADSATPGPGWPDLGDPPIGRLDGRLDAALIVVIDDAGRAGAWEVGSGWWRYLVRTRGLKKSRVQLLRNEAASARAIMAAIERMEARADAGSMLWLIYIGAGESPSDGRDGRLRAGDGQLVEFAAIRQRLAAGYHESAFILLDACASDPSPGFVGGVAANPPVIAPPPPRPTDTLTFHPTKYGFGLGGAAARARDQIDLDVKAEQATPRNTFIVSAGTGERCATELGGRPWPALAYVALGGLQGWADIDKDGWVGGRELTIYGQAAIVGFADGDARPPASVTLEAGGVDLILADVGGFAPHSPSVAWRRRHAKPPEPGLAGQTDEALRTAAELVDFDLEDMLAVPEGEFFMGCDRENDDACEPDEWPSHNVELRRFAIDRTEVTWADVRACMARGSCSPPWLESCWVWDGEGFVRGAELPPQMLADDHPAVCVSWDEAARYCESVGKRLPTEAEWERAARGVDGRIYPWGNEAPSCKTVAMDGCAAFTRPVGHYPAGASPVGALDMAGNAAEWVHDWWHPRAYRRGVERDPTGPITGEVRGVRGGSFYSNDADLRVSYRYGLDPRARLSIVGFRCAR